MKLGAGIALLAIGIGLGVNAFAQMAESKSGTGVVVSLEGPRFTDVTRVRRGGGAYQVVLNLQDITAIGESEAYSWWGAPEPYSSASRLQIVRSMWILRQGKESLRVPRSSYADLANVTDVRVVPRKRGCDIVVQGGESVDSYTATFMVRGENVVERTVASRVFPDNWNERTAYTNTAPKE